MDPVPQPHPLVEAFGRPTWLELRAPEEARHLRSNPVPLDGGNGRRVLVVPGFLGSAESMRPLVGWLLSGGFDASVVPLDRNVRGSGWAVERIVEALDASHEPATVIGHSRGGQQSRVAVGRRPDKLTQLITLGAPLRHAVPRHFVLRSAVESLRLASRLGIYRSEDLENETDYETALLTPFDANVPWTSIWSKSDGIVAWQPCTDPAATSIEVDCSHRGLVESIPGFAAIAQALAEVAVD